MVTSCFMVVSVTTPWLSWPPVPARLWCRVFERPVAYDFHAESKLMSKKPQAIPRTASPTWSIECDDDYDFISEDSDTRSPVRSNTMIFSVWICRLFRFGMFAIKWSIKGFCSQWRVSGNRFQFNGRYDECESDSSVNITEEGDDAGFSTEQGDCDCFSQSPQSTIRKSRA